MTEENNEKQQYQLKMLSTILEIMQKVMDEKGITGYDKVTPQTLIDEINGKVHNACGSEDTVKVRSFELTSIFTKSFKEGSDWFEGKSNGVASGKKYKGDNSNITNVLKSKVNEYRNNGLESVATGIESTKTFGNVFGKNGVKKVTRVLKGIKILAGKTFLGNVKSSVEKAG